jgi:hypothetical protein
MIFIATLIAFSITMALMGLGVLLGRTALRNGCGDGCDCLGGEHEERSGRKA